MEYGDGPYERSRARAEAAAARIVGAMQVQGNEQWLLERIFALKTGKRRTSISLSEMVDQYLALPRKKPLNPRYAFQVRSIVKKFLESVSAGSPSLREMSEITPEIALKFVREQEARGLAAKSLNTVCGTMRSIFALLRKKAMIIENPFSDIPFAQGVMHSRKALNASQVKRLLELAREDSFAGPLIIAGACTALRLGDCCLLKKDNVKLTERLVAIKPSKDGAWVWIPIFAPLLAVLTTAMSSTAKNPSPYIFPEQARMYEANPDGIGWRVRKVFLKAGFIEEDGGDCGLMTQRTRGIRRANLRGFHSLRTSWITAALIAGVPKEVVIKITGHRAVQAVLENYFQPNAEQLREVLVGKM